MPIEFELFSATPGRALLRVTAGKGSGVSLDGSVLVIDGGIGRRRLSALPVPPDPEGIPRAAFAAPRGILDDGGPAAYALELPDGRVIDLPSPVLRAASAGRRVPPAARSGAAADYTWLLQLRMAERGIRFATQLRPRLAERGVSLSNAQVHRLVTGRPERLNLRVLAALCDILGCTPSDLIECGDADRS